MKHATCLCTSMQRSHCNKLMNKNRTIHKEFYEEQEWNKSLVQYLLSQKLVESSFDDHA